MARGFKRIPQGANGVFPTEALVAPLGTYQFTLLEHGTTAAVQNWTCTGGTITATGLFTAGAVEGEYTVTGRTSQGTYTVPVEIATFSPLTAFGVDLWSWCDVNAMGATEGVKLATIDDASGNGNHFRQFNGDPLQYPTNRTNVLNGYAVAESDGINTQLDSLHETPAGARTWCAVIRLLSPLPRNGQVPTLWTVANGNGRFYVNGSHNAEWTWFPANSFDAVYPAGDPLSWTVVTTRLTAVDSQQIQTNNNTAITFVPHSNVWTGADGLTDRLFAHDEQDRAKMQVALEGMITRAISDVEWRQLRRWLNGKYRAY